MSIAAAIAAAQAGDLHRCLDALLVAWRPRRLAELGWAIERVDAMINDGVPAPGGRNFHETWLALEARRSSADVGFLAVSFRDGPARFIRDRIERMFAWEPDPRVASGILRSQIRRDRYGYRGELTTLLAHHADERHRASSPRWELRTGERSWHVRALGEEKLATSAEEDELAQLGLVLDVHAERALQSERKFLGRIAGTRANDVRLVYADWLVERGHPRGELIVLESGARTAAVELRIRELKQLHARAIVGPFAQFLSRAPSIALAIGDVKTNRGLVTSLTIDQEPAMRWAESPPHWLLEEITARTHEAGGTAYDLFLESWSIAAIEGRSDLFGHVCRGAGMRSLNQVRLKHRVGGVQAILDLFPGTGCKFVRRLELDTHAAVEAWPSMPNIEEIAIASPLVRATLERLRPVAPKLRLLSFLRRDELPYAVDLTLDERREPIAVTVRPIPSRFARDDGGAALRTIMSQLPAHLRA